MRICGAASYWTLASLLLAMLAIDANAQTTYTVLHIFSGTDGSQPDGTLLRDGQGNIYGTTFYGGTFGAGTVFKIDTTDNETVLYNFTGGTDGGYPHAGLVRDVAGNLYGTTEGGGTAAASGTVFKLDPSGNETALYSFAGGLDGSSPYGELLRDAAGNLYGATLTGGRSNCESQGCGTVFKLDTAGRKIVLHNFTGWPYDGAFPVGPLIQDAAGNIYGSTIGGGHGNQGTVYRLSSSGAEAILHVFVDNGYSGARVDGSSPDSGVISDASGNLYGTTSLGGAFNKGAVFKIDAAGNETLLYSFAGYPTDAAFPSGGLVRDSEGNLYGSGQSGTLGFGAIFMLDNKHNETLLHNVAGGTEGAYPVGALIRNSASGSLYGNTQAGGTTGNSGGGVVFELTLP
jgi:uncharacterized repeat protein (TIGR03803 family)